MSILNLLLEDIENYKELDNHKFSIGKYYVKVTDECYTLCNLNSVIKLQHDGKIFRLNKTGKYQRCDQKGWEVYCDIFNEVDKQKTIRMEIPIERKTIILNQTEFDFIEIHRPNKQLGTTFYDDLRNNIVDEKYFLDYIDETTEMLNYIFPIVMKHNIGYSIDLLAPYKRNKDSNGYFWIDFKRWSKPFDEFYKIKLRYLYVVLLNLKTIDHKKIMNYAEYQWGKFLK